jgi:hypothetical protein
MKTQGANLVPFVSQFAQGGEEKYAPPVLVYGASLWQVGLHVMHAQHSYNMYGLFHALVGWGFVLACMFSMLVFWCSLVWLG